VKHETATVAQPDKWTYRGARTGRTRGGATVFVPRRDLRESLESYAARVGLPVHKARAMWRRESLRLLHVDAPDADVTSGLCAIAPGVAVHTAFVDWPDWHSDGGVS
jgi:hypothetical protein